jgi:hypothetical protein
VCAHTRARVVSVTHAAPDMRGKTRRSKHCIEHEAMRIYRDTLQRRKATDAPATEEAPRSNAVPVEAKPTLASASQEWLYFKSQTAAKRHCFGKRGVEMNTRITYALKSGTGSVLGWVFRPS